MAVFAAKSDIVTYNNAGVTLSFSSSNTYEWEWVSSTNKLRSTNYNKASTTSQTTITIYCPFSCDFTFNYSVYSESTDRLNIALDGASIVNEGGNFSRTSTKILPKGTHTLVLKYTKDSSINTGDDRAYAWGFKFSKSYNVSTNFDFELNDLYYNVVSLNDLTCEVTHGNGYEQTSIYLPNSVDFSGKTMKVVGINNLTFADDLNLTDFNFSEHVENIGSAAFFNCNKLQNLSIPNNVTIIPDSMAMYCSSLKNLSLGESTTSIGKSSFYNCSSLSKIDLPSAITTIDNNAFSGCSKVKKLTIGDSNSTLNLGKNGGYDAFYGLPIDTLYVGKNLNYDKTNAQYAPFYSNSTLKQLTIGNQVTEFPDASLATKTTLTDLYVGDGLKEIPSFNTCVNLKKLTLGAGLTSIPTFVACEQIDTIYLRSTTPQPAEEFTNKIYVNCILKVPAGSLAAYQSADVWKNFWLISEYDVQSGTDSTPGLRISRSNIQLREGSTSTLTAKIFPENVLCENIQWKSDNSAIASINQAGLVTAIKEGTAHIIALTTDGTNYSDTCLVTVRPPFDLGDVNDDGSINVADVNGVVNFILDTNTENLIYRAADINKDNRILVDDLSDIITMVMEGATPNQARAKMQTRIAQTYDNYMVITPGEDSYDIAVSLAEKDNDFSGLQFDVTLPEGYVIDDATVANEDAQLVWNQLPNNEVRVMVYSPSNTPICSGENVVSLKLGKLTGTTDDILIIHGAVATDNKAKAYGIGSCQYQLSEATNISSVDAPMNSNHAIYNLLGQKVNIKNKGIYIYKGQKFVNK